MTSRFYIQYHRESHFFLSLNKLHIQCKFHDKTRKKYDFSEPNTNLPIHFYVCNQQCSIL